MQTAGDSSLMDDSIGPGGMRGGPSFRTMSKQDYLLLYGMFVFHDIDFTFARANDLVSEAPGVHETLFLLLPDVS
jgi:hypothetical protein